MAVVGFANFTTPDSSDYFLAPAHYEQVETGRMISEIRYLGGGDFMSLPVDFAQFAYQNPEAFAKAAAMSLMQMGLFALTEGMSAWMEGLALGGEMATCSSANLTKGRALWIGEEGAAEAEKQGYQILRLTPKVNGSVRSIDTKWMQGRSQKEGLRRKETEGEKRKAESGNGKRSKKEARSEAWGVGRWERIQTGGCCHLAHLVNPVLIFGAWRLGGSKPKASAYVKLPSSSRFRRDESARQGKRKREGLHREPRELRERELGKYLSCIWCISRFKASLLFQESEFSSKAGNESRLR